MGMKTNRRNWFRSVAGMAVGGIALALQAKREIAVPEAPKVIDNPAYKDAPYEMAFYGFDPASANGDFSVITKMTGNPGGPFIIRYSRIVK